MTASRDARATAVTLPDAGPREPTAREQCIASHEACERAGTPIAFRTSAALVGGLLKQMSAESARTFLEVAARTARAIVNEEKPKGEAE
jgi:hypothetical protein